MTPGPGWERALERAARSPVTLLLGAVDSGKTVLATFLANGLLERGLRVGVVDADLGQSEIGPPTTIGLGRIRHELERLGDAELRGLFFVGVPSPPGHLRSTVTGTRKMVDRAAALGLERVLVDTSGLVEGELGRTLKQHKIDLLDPDLVICLARAQECEPILELYGRRRRPEILRLAVSALARKRSAAERQRHRARSFEAYFHDATMLRIPLGAVALSRMGDRPDPGALPLSGGDESPGLLVGLDDRAGETLGLGVLRQVDLAGRALLVDTPIPGGLVTGVRLGRYALDLLASPVIA